MKGIRFHKMVASGNDFVVVDNRRRIVRNPVAFTRAVCAAHTGAAADGVLLVEPSRKTAFKMRIYNSDGSQAEACGNGFRCIARYGKEILGLPARFRFESLSGTIEANVTGSTVRVQLVEPSDYRVRRELVVFGHRLHYSFINTGVPHAVIFVAGLEKIDVDHLGRAIRRHESFQPKGTNVNFVEVKGRSRIEVRTYERGVEAETLACGTGSTASAVVSALSGYARPPVEVKTRGGEILTIDFKIRGRKISGVTLEGKARFVY
ncbi:MAG: diaminopimelate epimerase, partial [Candidatus Omnitrophota bacterium]